MITNLINSLILGKLAQLELSVAGNSDNGYFDSYTFCSDGSCSGDCVGGCDGTPAGGF